MRTLLQRLQFSWALELRELQLKIYPNIWFNYIGRSGHLKYKTVSFLYWGTAIFSSLSAFFQNYDWTDFNVNVRKTHFLYTGRDQKCSEAFPCRHIIGISSLNSSHCVIEIIEILTLCNWNNWNPNFLWVECFLAFSQWCLSLFRRKQQREIGAKLKPI